MAPPRITLAEAIKRFWSRVGIAAVVPVPRPEVGPCWPWLRGGRYGSVWWLGERRAPHQVSYELAFGSFNRSLFVLHRCDNPRCVNPAHLFLGDAAVNMRDMSAKGRSTRGRRRPRTGPAGARNAKAKLSPKDVVELRALHARGVTYAALSKRFGVSKSQVGNIVSRVHWKEVG